MKGVEIIKQARKENRSLLEPEAYRLLQDYAIPVLDYRLAGSAEEAESLAAEIGFPVAMKVVSPDVIHKSDSGGVELGVADEKGALAAYNKIVKNVTSAVEDPDIKGVMIVPMISGGTEVITGMIRDPQFGPAVMFGLGGIFVEILKDVVFGIAPVSRGEAEEMIRGIKGYPLLAGARGGKPADIDSLAEIIVGLSKLALDIDEISEIDLNPVLATPERSFVLDARILL